MASYQASRLVRFGKFAFDMTSRELSRDGVRIRLPQQPIQVLCALLERPGEVVSREELQKLLWPTDVFVDFDQGLNKSIQKLREALRDSPEEPRFIETIPRAGYRFIAPVIAETAAESHTPQVKIGPAAEESPGPLANANRVHDKAKWLVLAGCVTVALLALGWFVAHRQHATQSIRSIAVLPLDNLTGDPSQDYFADGMTDELITMLAKDSTLRITSRTSVMQYKGVHRPLTEIAHALNVDAIVEGSVRRSDSGVHVTLQLIRADTDSHLWANSYDRSPGEIANLPGEAARDIAKQLRSSSPTPAVARFVSPQAHDAYLRGRYLWFRGQNEEAGKEFRKAVELQPDYALGWVGISSYYGVGILSGKMDPVQAIPQAEAATQKAVDLDDGLAEGHLVLGAAIFTYQWDFDRGLQEMSRAIALDPRLTQAIHLRARFLNIMGRHQEAVQEQKTASEIDPFERPWAMVTILDEARQYDAALAEARQHMQAEPNMDMYELVAVAYRGKSMPTEWAQALEKHFQLAGEPDSAAAVERAFKQGGQKAVVQWQLDQLERKSKTNYVSPVALALLHAQLGDREKTLALLEAGYREHSPLLLWIQLDPAYDFLHSDERYRSIIKRVGLPPSY
jgi:TolB-like protein/DNA-binding winged helix-turn-helix (wHTH) protein